MGIEFVSSGNLVQITNVDISQPIMVSAYVNSTSTSLPTITFSGLTEICNGSGSKSNEGVKSYAIVGTPNSPIIGILFGGSSLGTNYDYTVVAYQVTIQ